MEKNHIEWMRSLHKDGYTYEQIAEHLGCSTATVCYYLNNPYQEHKKRYQKARYEEMKHILELWKKEVGTDEPKKSNG